jgi:hypothetical protein
MYVDVIIKTLGKRISTACALGETAATSVPRQRGLRHMGRNDLAKAVAEHNAATGVGDACFS